MFAHTLSLSLFLPLSKMGKWITHCPIDEIFQLYDANKHPLLGFFRLHGKLSWLADIQIAPETSTVVLFREWLDWLADNSWLFPLSPMACRIPVFLQRWNRARLSKWLKQSRALCCLKDLHFDSNIWSPKWEGRYILVDLDGSYTALCACCKAVYNKIRKIKIIHKLLKLKQSLQITTQQLVANP